MPRKQDLLITIRACLALNYAFGAVAHAHSDTVILRLAEAMTPVDLIKESTKYAGEALKAFSKSKSGDIAQACS